MPVLFVLVQASLGGVAIAATMTALVRRTWRRGGGRAEMHRRDDAVRSGMLPPDADASRLPGLRARRENAGQSPWLFAGLVPVSLLLAVVDADQPVAVSYWCLLAVGAAVTAVRRFRRGPSDRAVLDRLITELEARTSPRP